MENDRTGVDESLLQLISEQDEKSLEMLYDRYGRLIFSLACRVIGNITDAEDIAQEVFVKIWNCASGYDCTKGRAYTWIMTIARNHAIGKLRSKIFKNKTQETSIEEMSTSHNLEVTDGSVVTAKKDDLHIVKNAVQELSEHDRLVVELAYFEGLTHSQIARHIDIPLGTIKTRLRRGMIELKQLLGNKV